MPYITAEGFAQVPIPAGSVLVIGGQSTVRLAPPYPANMSPGPWVTNAAEDRIGPFQTAVTLNIRMGTNPASYTILDPSAEASLSLGGGRSLQAAASAAQLAQGKANVIESWCAGSGAYTNTGPVTRTWQLIFATRAKAYAVRVKWKNPQAAIITIDKTTITPSTTLVLNGEPTGGAAEVNVLWAGSAADAMPAAASVAEETMPASDWMLIVPLAWTGVPNYALYHLRCYVAVANYSYISSANLAGYTDNVIGGLVRQWGFHNAAGDKTAPGSGYVGSGSNAVALPVELEFRTVGRVHRMLGIGDSTFNCSTFTAGGQFASWLEAAARILNSALTTAFYSADNFGWSSQSIAAYSARLPSILAAASYEYVFIQTYSPNTAPTTQAALDANIGRVLDMIKQVRDLGAIPILTMGLPSVLLTTAADDAWRLLSNATWRAYCLATGTAACDVEPTFTDNATPGRIPAAYSGDGTHITTIAGQAVWAAAAAAAVQVAR